MRKKTKSFMIRHQIDQMRHDRLVAVGERGQARAESVLGSNSDVAVVRRRLKGKHRWLRMATSNSSLWTIQDLLKYN